MAVRTREELKALFEAGDTPDAQAFIDLIDTFLLVGGGDLPDPLPAVSGENLTNIPIPDPLPAVSGENLTDVPLVEWISASASATKVDDTHFTVSGDLTEEFVEDRTVRLPITGAGSGYFISPIVSSVYASGTGLTTVTVLDTLPTAIGSQASVSFVLPSSAGGSMTPQLIGAGTAAAKDVGDTANDVAPGTGGLGYAPYDSKYYPGDFRTTARTTADTGWLISDGRTIGNIGSGADVEGASLEDLFNVLKGTPWSCNGYTNAGTEVFANGDTVVIPDMRGRGFIGAGFGDADYATTHTLGDKSGAEKHLLLSSECGVPPHNHPGATRTSTQGDNGVYGYLTTIATTTGNNTAQDAAAAHSIMSPQLCVNVMIKI